MSYLVYIPFEDDLLGWCVSRVFQKTLCKKDESLEHIFNTYESAHPYAPNIKNTWRISIPEAAKLRFYFDKRCNIEGDSLMFYKDEELTTPISKKIT